MKTNRRNLIKSTVALGTLIGIGSLMPPQKSFADALCESYPSLDALKKGIPDVVRWWNFNYRGASFAICLRDLLTANQSRQWVNAWRRLRDYPYCPVWSFRTEGIGPIEVSVDELNGSISAKAKANTELKDSSLPQPNLPLRSAGA